LDAILDSDVKSADLIGIKCSLVVDTSDEGIEKGN
jgi:hypothetical protein